MKVYNTLTREKEEFLSTDTEIRMYVCGPTVYEYIHIGNARTYLTFDIVAKWLRYRGYGVKYIMNVTDIDDKIIDRSTNEGRDVFEYAQEYTDHFLADVSALNIDSVDEYPLSRDHIDVVISQVQTLLDKGNAYVIPNEGIYFDLKTYEDYGELSHRTVGMAEDGVSRVDVSEKKRNAGDFVLWKSSKEGEPSWDETFVIDGENVSMQGRPGWHIEDTAITEKYFGPQYEIHGAGIDLMFPHHEAERAQQESASGLKPFVKYWMHAGFLTTKKERMGKSKDNFLTLNNALKMYSPEVLRFYFSSAHYRSPLEYSEDNMISAQAAVQRLSEFYRHLVHAKGFGDVELSPDKAIAGFESDMNDDFNVPNAISHIFEFVRQANPHVLSGQATRESIDNIRSMFDKFDAILGIVIKDIETVSEEIDILLREREAARDKKDYATSDKIRDKISDMGYSIDDTPYGPLVKK